MQSNYVGVLKKYDFSFFAFAILIFSIGILNLYSATHAVTHGPLVNLYKTQLMWFGISMTIGLGVSFIRPKNILRSSYFIYGVNILLLVLVLMIGTKVLGAKRWLNWGFFRMQPSEMMKISIVLGLARWYSSTRPEDDLGLKELIIPFLFTLIPAVLIIMEPDLGTGLVVILIFLVVTVYRRLKWKTVGIICILSILSGTVMYRFGLKNYQRQRIITFLDPWRDARGHGYNAIQSEIAIGSGKLFGKGFGKSSQASLSYLPENHTDFVFSLYILLVLIFLGLSKSISLSKKGSIYIQDGQALANYFQGQLLSIILVDIFEVGLIIKTYYHQYKIIYGLQHKKNIWISVRTSRKFFRQNIGNLGLSLYRSTAEGQMSYVPMPPGTLFMANPRYGTWEGGQNDQKFWRFYRSYQYLTSMLGWGNFRPSYLFYQKLMKKLLKKQTFFGLNDEFGTNGSLTKKNFPHFFTKRRNDGPPFSMFFKNLITHSIRRER